MSAMWPTEAEASAWATRPLRTEPVYLDLTTTEAAIDEDPNDHSLSLVLHDKDEGLAQLVIGLDDSGPDGQRAAIRALEAVAEMAERLAGLLRVRAGDRRPLPQDLAVVEALAEAAPGQQRRTHRIPPVNA